MVISEESQERILNNWNTQDKTTKEYLAFIDGMEAAFDLVDKIMKTQKL